MKTLALLLAATGLASVAACSRSPQETAVLVNADALADNLEMQADNLEMLADNSADSDAAIAMENASDGLDQDAANVREAADAKVDAM